MRRRLEDSISVVEKTKPGRTGGREVLFSDGFGLRETLLCHAQGLLVRMGSGGLNHAFT